MVLKVQLAWMYLENIFIGSEDIARQLPSETEMFGTINTRFIKLMQEMHKTSNVVLACTAMRALGAMCGLGVAERRRKRLRQSGRGSLKFPRSIHILLLQ